MRLFRHRAPVRVTVYSKPGCHLCEDALELLRRIDRGGRLQIEEIDIRSDPALFRAYDVRIPVVVIEGATEIEAPVTERALRRALRSPMRRLPRAAPSK
ncbi:MAG: glutaredoxin family protein [Chloroflexi bacterium]|nr:glutaredoxin family protein [Chloroflexota bacterium]